ncbi:S9 family peptidase [Alloacidobacterium sp.]|uniref:S9 family peptidase n=1 Tax=Alloacidobacterium sp. TaxID=2951999 RepID=UPI002D2616B7|nr:S9 family peptidase [Alloacidobacterium sp.]HYK35793.1 S9 family peptidase [Alloacidobacterium sp.]
MTIATRPTQPVARPQHTETTLHGHTLVDDYAWLRDKESTETLAYLQAENDYTAAVLESTQEMQQTLYKEMLSHIKETDVSVPFRDGDYWYYTRTEEGLQYPIFCRKHGSLDAPEAIILDVNKLAEGESFMAVGAMTVSDDANLLAYSFDNTGFRQYTLQVKNLRTGELLPERVERVGSIVWAADNKTIFYTVEDEEQKRQYQLFRHKLGTPHSPDALVYEETDERFNIGAGRTRDNKYIILESGSHTTSEARFLPADSPEAEFRLIAPRRDNIEYYPDHRNGLFFIRVNDAGRNFRLVTTPVENPAVENWRELLLHRQDVMLEEVDLFSGFYVACERYDGLPYLRVVRFADADLKIVSEQEIAFPEPVYSAHPHQNRVFDSTTYRYAYQSLVTPSSVYEYDITTGESKLLKQVEIPGGFDRAKYASERVFATAPDGVRVSVSLVYRKDKFQRGKNPLYVYGYGSYGYSLPIGFNGNRLSLLDRGFVMAYAHIRGGGDMGKPWHDAGRLMQKRNTFTDFVAVVEHLLANGYGDPARVAIEGGSAGGLLMGAVSNLRPDLFRAVLSHVPFVDVMNTMLDASLPLTVPEYEEWGNPNEKPAFEYMLSYSPYDNLEAKAYPAMLVKTSLHDSQVMYWEPAKYVAKLRTLKTDNNPLLLRTNMTAGHGGASGRYDYLKEIAMDYAFLLKELNVAA